ncbi:N/A [soil metagenome]|jgi:RNA polymerase sigma-B factor
MSSSSADRLSKAELHEVVLRYQEQGEDRDAEQIIQQIEPLILSRVRRVLRPNTEFDDLYQVARMAAFRAIGRWRPDGGASFTTYATRTMDGSLKRYFRDRMWDVHVTRSAKNLSLRVTKFVRHFETDHGRKPTLLELADYSGMTPEEAAEGMTAANAYSSESLDVPVTEDGAELGALLPDETKGPDREVMMDIYREIRGLPDRQKRIVYMSYFHDLTQREIANRVGCSQMHVSRLLRRSLTTVRDKVSP